MRIAVRAMRLSCVAAPVWPGVFRFQGQKQKKKKHKKTTSSESLARPGFEIPDAEKRVRKLLMAAAHSFSDAAGVAAAQGASTAASFLQPVDANRLRGSLRATEAMRASPPMAVNVLVAEDLRGMQRDAQQRGAAEQLEALRQSFEDDLISLDAV